MKCFKDARGYCRLGAIAHTSEVSKTSEVLSPRGRIGVIALTLLLSPFSQAASKAGPPPLPADMQAKVNKAIDKGVSALLMSMNQWGNWAPEDKHLVGYSALPGLTLLECGVPATDPRVKKAATFVRKMAPGLKATYEIALAILFLDKLGETRDEAVIEMLAMRLIAGQTPTGGWTYKCPILERSDQKNLLSLLRKLNNPELFDPIMAANANLNVGLPRNGEFVNPLNRDAQATFNDPLSREIRRKSMKRNEGTSVSTEFANSQTGSIAKQRDVPKPDPRMEPASPSATRNWAWCIKMEDSSAGLPKPPAKVVIPARYRELPVFFPPAALNVMDPKDKGELPIWGTSDNSNTQFALLGIWTAQRHRIPTARTLNLIAKRFYTSQNKDGSWGYHYIYGGGDPERPPMTCVGLLGLAVAQGLAHDINPSVLRKQDPAIVNGLIALSKNVGMPQGRTDNLPMANLYFLWSVERVAVLYDLPTIANKDWYRWGAEILLANQVPPSETDKGGYWDKGGYHGAKPVTDTCLALLFLKRANLREITDKLAFRSDDLLMALAKRLPGEEKPPPPQKVVTVNLNLNEIKKEPVEEKPALSPIRRVAAPGGTDRRTERQWQDLVLGILLLVILSGIGLVFLARDKDEDENERVNSRRARRTKNQVRG